MRSACFICEVHIGRNYLWIALDLRMMYLKLKLFFSLTGEWNSALRFLDGTWDFDIFMNIVFESSKKKKNSDDGSIVNTLLIAFHLLLSFMTLLLFSIDCLIYLRSLSMQCLLKSK